jgi:hypothetical protein
MKKYVYKVIYGAKSRVFKTIERAREFRSAIKCDYKDIIIRITEDDGIL